MSTDSENRKFLTSGRVSELIAIFLFITLVASIIYAIIHIVDAPSRVVVGYEHTRSDYVLILLQCIVGLIVIALPSAFERKWAFTIPHSMYIMFFIFLYCAIYLGEVQAFYYIIPHWDTILHAFSGAMLGALGFILVSILNTNERVPLKTSPFFVAFFAFTFAVAAGAMWEIYEFTADTLLGTNMQKFQDAIGNDLPGRAALMDTMKDIIIDAAAAFVTSLFGYISLKRRKHFIVEAVE